VPPQRLGQLLRFIVVKNIKKYGIMVMALSKLYTHQSILIVFLVIDLFFLNSITVQCAIPDEIFLNNDLIEINLEDDGVPYFIANNDNKYIIRHKDRIYFIENEKRTFIGKIIFEEDGYISDFRYVYIGDINFDGKYEFFIPAGVSIGRRNQSFYLVDSEGRDIAERILSRNTKQAIIPIFGKGCLTFSNPQFNMKLKKIFMSSVDGVLAYHYLLYYDNHFYKLEQLEIPFLCSNTNIHYSLNKVIHYNNDIIDYIYVVYYGSDKIVAGKIVEQVDILSNSKNTIKRKRIFQGTYFTVVDIIHDILADQIWLKIMTETETGWLPQNNQIVLFAPDG
jgi:hypothetical protein